VQFMPREITSRPKDSGDFARVYPFDFIEERLI
jgi:hypothetical protein